MCGGVGMVIGVIIFFAWWRSEKTWQKVIAWICAIAVGWSMLIMALAFTS